MPLFKQIGVYLICGAFISILWVIYQKLSYRNVVPDADGWITLKPGLMSIVMGLFSVALTVLFGTFTVGTIFNLVDDGLFFLLLGPPLTALMGFSSFIILWVRVRSSSQGIERRGLKGWSRFSWESVISVDSHEGLGPRIHVEGHRPLYFWPYGYGVNETREMFIKYDKPFSLT